MDAKGLIEFSVMRYRHTPTFKGNLRTNTTQGKGNVSS